LEFAGRQSEARLLALLDNAPGAVFIKDTQGRYLFASKSFVALTGRTAAEVIGMTDVELFDPETAATFADEDAQVRAGRGTIPFEESFVYEGRRFWFLTHKFLLPGGDVAGIAIDQTPQREAEEALRLSEERLRLATEGSGVGTYDLDLSTGRGIWSATAFRLLGLDPTEGLEGTYALWRDSIHADDVARVEAEHAAAMATNAAWHIEYRAARATGRTRWLQAYGHFEPTAQGGLRSIGIVTDITDRKVWEEHQRLLVSELNHRVKNTLAVVQGIAFQTFRTADGDRAEVKAFEGRLMALAAAHNMLTNQNWEAADLHDLAAAVLRVHAIGETRALTAGAPARISPEPAVTITLVLHELATNALKYGSLSVPEGQVHILWEAIGDQLVIEWRETGGPTIAEPAERGFGTRMIERAFTRQLAGTVEFAFEPDGFICRLAAPLAAVNSSPEGS
jgi:PAS domain S-box-containing protein